MMNIRCLSDLGVIVLDNAISLIVVFSEKS